MTINIYILVLFIYLFINMALTLIFGYLDTNELGLLVLPFILPFFLIAKFFYQLFNRWLFSFKAFLIFGRNSKPIYVAQSRIIGKERKKGTNYFKRLFKRVSKEEKKEYIELIEKRKSEN